ncbi:hypothetical protein D9M68_830140 [compost metagenome]
MIEVVVEALFNRDLAAMFALADLRDDAAVRCLDDPSQHAILDAERTFVLQEDDLVAGGEFADALLCLEDRTILNDPAIDEFSTRQFVEHADITAQMRKDQGRLGRIVVAVPVGDKV